MGDDDDGVSFLQPQQQRLCIARALTANPEILLLSILMSAAYWYLVRRASRRMEGSA